MVPVVLCNRPNCLHSGETDAARRQACNAYFNATPYALMQYYEGNLYAFIVVPREVYTDADKLQLIKISPDGTKRKILYETTTGGQAPKYMAIHRGKLYYTTDTYTQDGTHTNGIKEIDLDKPSDEPLVIFSGDKPASSMTGLFPYGNNLYFMDNEWDKYYLMRYDMLDGTTTSIDNYDFYNRKSESGYTGIVGQGFGTIYKDKLYYNNWTDAIDESWCADLDGGNAVKITQPSLQIPVLASDGRYIFADKMEAISEYVAEENITYARGETHDIHILDETGKEYAHLDLGNMEGRLVAGGEGYAFYVCIANTDSQRKMLQVYYADKSQIENGVFEFKLLLQGADS
jgi:hypothetical protein